VTRRMILGEAEILACAALQEEDVVEAIDATNTFYGKAGYPRRQDGRSAVGENERLVERIQPGGCAVPARSDGSTRRDPIAQAWPGLEEIQPTEIIVTPLSSCCAKIFRYTIPRIGDIAGIVFNVIEEILPENIVMARLRAIRPEIWRALHNPSR
jgi:hypothetical protein